MNIFIVFINVVAAEYVGRHIEEFNGASLSVSFNGNSKQKTNTQINV